MGEEAIRNHLLIGLNGMFEGAAGVSCSTAPARPTSSSGKMWSKRADIEQALKQLFSYLVWRDAKAALLVFIRAANAWPWHRDLAPVRHLEGTHRSGDLFGDVWRVGASTRVLGGQ